MGLNTSSVKDSILQPDSPSEWRELGSQVKEAKVYASMQADACFEVGDITGKATWLRVIAAIDELQYTSPSEGPKSVH
jgi:hypothetical protein